MPHDRFVAGLQLTHALLCFPKLLAHLLILGTLLLKLLIQIQVEDVEFLVDGVDLIDFVLVSEP
jgi:hypothetical protein